MRLDTSFIVGVWLEALVYGAYVVAFAVCLRLFRTHAPVVGRALPIWLGALFVLATAHCALSLSATLDAFVRVIYTGSAPLPPGPTPSHVPGGTHRPPPGPQSAFQYRDPTRYIGNRALPANLAGLGIYAGIVLLSDLMLLYRLLVKYRYRFIWVIGPTLLTIGSFVISIIVVTKYAHIDQTVNYETLQKELESVNPWVPPTYAISFLANLSITALMMAKASFGAPKSSTAFATRRRHTRHTSLSAGDGYVFDMDERTGPVPGASAPAKRRTMSTRWALLAGIVECGALAPLFMLAALILYVAQDAQETLLVPMLAPLAALIPTLQIIQLQLGLDSEARNRPVSQAWSESERTNEQGRSPYLVPAPRYHDSSSEEEVSDGEARLVNGAQARKEKSRRSRSSSNNEPVSPTTAKRFSARNIWAWRGGPSGSRTVSGSGSHSYSNSQSSARTEQPVMLQMRDLTGSAERAGESDKARNGDLEDGIWERIKLDDSKTDIPEPRPVPVPVPAPLPMPRRKSTLRKNSISKDMISKPVPIAADFPPTTAGMPSTAILPVLPNFTINAETGVTPKSISRNLSFGAAAEHKYHYRVRPREKTASPLVAYLSAQALAQTTSQVDEREKDHPHPHQHQAPPSSSGHQPPSSSGHLMSLPSTTPTSPASGFTSLNPHSASRNPFRYDGQPESMHKPSYSDVRRAEPSLPESVGGIGLLGARRSPLSVPFPTSEPDTMPRWAPMPGAPRIIGLDTFFPPGRPGRHGEVDVERDVSPAPGLRRDYTLARDEVLRQMHKDKGGGMSDDESVYSTQLLANVSRR
ncbi:putative transmembrane protein [Rhizoctonia solani 123E]|uniref:Putative transmembrane protein n=1 Tax=Rhizoctonia solani 123E TaxID=1423351 RepID=A0A074RMW4_9AGAM|nr:putative transmembrane protein [Rhizoctonia solani 123E]